MAAANKKTKGGVSRSYSSAVKTQRVIIQRCSRDHRDDDCNNRNQTALNESDILTCLPLEQLVLELNRYRSANKKPMKKGNINSHQQQQQLLTLATMGPLQSILFLDDTSLFWNTRRVSGHSNNNNERREEIISNADTHFDGVDGGLGGEYCLSLQFSRLLTIVRFSESSGGGGSSSFLLPRNQWHFTVLCCLEGQQQNTKENKNPPSQYVPTSSLIPVTNSIVVYGCSDGAMRFHNIVPSLLYSSRMDNASTMLSLNTSLFSSGNGKLIGKSQRQATVKSVRGPNGRNDPIVKIVNVDPAYYSSMEKELEGVAAAAAAAAGDVRSLYDSKTVMYHSRLLTACASGVGYLWDIHIRVDRSTGSVRDLSVDPPLLRIDGLGKLTVSPRRASPVENMRSDGFWMDANASKTQKDKDTTATPAPYSGSIVPAIHYDYNRDLLLWTLPSEAPASSIDHRGDFKMEVAESDSAEARREEEDKSYLVKWTGENGGFVKVWNMSMVNALVFKSKKKESAGGGPQPPPKFAPAAIYKLHPFSASAALPSQVLSGLQLGPLSPTSLACTCLSRDGSELLVQAAPLPMTTTSTDDSWLVQSSISSIPKKRSSGADKVKILYAAFSTSHTLPISRMIKSSESIRVRGSLFAASLSSPDSLVVVSDQGVISGNIAKGQSWHSEIESHPLPGKNHSSPIPFDSQAGNVHAIISGGPVSSLNNRPGVVFVENNSVYASRLATPKSSGDHQESIVEKISLQDPMLMHVLQGRSKPWNVLRTTRISIFAEVHSHKNSQPKLIPSPSGRYICLFWENEMKYEILHAGSLLTKGPINADGTSNPIDPSVDSGSQVLSYAWVGDDDRFAVIRYVDLGPSKVSVQSSPARTEQLPPPLDTRRKLFSRLILEGNNTETGRIKSHVELNMLAEAQTDAVELAAGAGVAAATIVDLGRLPVRGGDRSVPTTLFGGPALCVGCISISSRSSESSIDSSMAYFYTRKSSSAQSHDEKGSSYTTVGSELPYPSLVIWDEEGKLCAIAIGSRVAIYLSEPPNFTLLGAVNITGVLISLKFIHGVLYASTQSSVHAIFLGNIDDQDTVCEIDVFTLATTQVPLGGTDNLDGSYPVPAVASLMQPHILAYYCGGLLLSTSCGLRLLPLCHPILRIGTLLGANLLEKARKWIYTIPNSEHDALSDFLIRRGHPDLAISELELSVERYIDLCMLYNHTDELEYLVEREGPALITQISDWKRGSINGSYSAIFCIGVYLLSQDRIPTAKKWVECAMNSGIDEVVSDAMKISLYISAADRPGGEELLKRASEVLKLDPSGQIAFLGTT